MSINLNDSTPAAPAGSLNGLWQKDVSGNVSVNVPDTTNAANIISGTLAVARGGTAADLSATGGAHQVLKQSSIGAAVTVGQLAESDLSFSNITTNNVTTSQHGLVPILPNDAAKFLNGVGAYAVPPGTSTVPSFADNETPSGTVNGSNVTFTLAHTPSPSASLILAHQGIIQISGTDFTLSTATITFTAAPITGDLLTAWYRY